LDLASACGLFSFVCKNLQSLPYVQLPLAKAKHGSLALSPFDLPFMPSVAAGFVKPSFLIPAAVGAQGAQIGHSSPFLQDLNL
jgi:hypothetical protein